MWPSVARRTIGGRRLAGSAGSYSRAPARAPYHSRLARTQPVSLDNPHGQTDALIPGRGQADPASRHPLALFEQGDLPARTGLECIGRLRQAALRGARQTGAVRGCARTAGARRIRRRSQDPHDHRQRHRHVGRRGRRQPRNDRQERHARIRRRAGVDPAEGCATHRPVRRGFLQRLHRRGPHHGRVAPRRAAGRAGGFAGRPTAAASSRSRPSPGPSAAPA